MSNQVSKTILFDLGTLTIYGHTEMNKPMAVLYYSWSDSKLNLVSEGQFNTLYDTLSNYKQLRKAMNEFTATTTVVPWSIPKEEIIEKQSNVINVDFKQKRRLQ